MLDKTLTSLTMKQLIIAAVIIAAIILIVKNWDSIKSKFSSND